MYLAAGQSCAVQEKKESHSRGRISAARKGAFDEWGIQPIKRRFCPAALIILFAVGCGFSTGKQEYEEGILAYGKGAYQEAANHFAAAVEENGDRAEYYLYYGFALTELGSYDAAVENFSKVILQKDFTSVQENNKRAYRGMGIAHYLAGNEERALENFYAALQVPLLVEMDEDIRSYLIQVNASLLERYRVAGELERARELCDELLSSYGESADLFRMRADLWMEEENYEAALTDFDAAVAAGDSRMSTLLGKLMALKALGRKEEADAVSAKIATMQPDNDDEVFAGALAAYSIGDYDTAKPALERLSLGGMLRADYYLAQIAILQQNYTRSDILENLRKRAQKMPNSIIRWRCAWYMGGSMPRRKSITGNFWIWGMHPMRADRRNFILYC